jgi:hypothetical protein
MLALQIRRFPQLDHYKRRPRPFFIGPSVFAIGAPAQTRTPLRGRSSG